MKVQHPEAVAGALLVLGGMLCEWGLPIRKAVKGLRAAYKIEQAKQRHDIGERSE